MAGMCQGSTAARILSAFMAGDSDAAKPARAEIVGYGKSVQDLAPMVRSGQGGERPYPDLSIPASRNPA